MMSHRNEERDEHRSPTRHPRQEVQHPTNHRAQHHIPSSRHNIDRYSLPINQIRTAGYGKFLNLFIQLNRKKNHIDIR
jgi:hypothetical protein